MSALNAVAAVVAQTPPPDDMVQPGPMAGVLFTVLAFVIFLLWRSMNRHLKRVAALSETQQTSEAGQAEGTGAKGPNPS